MSTTEIEYDALLDGFSLDKPSNSILIDGIARDPNELYPLQPGEIDPRLRNLSYSSLLDLHSCPRYFELGRKRTTYRADNTEIEAITFSFGHVVGAGIASIFAGRSWNEIVMEAFLGWEVDLYASDDKADKSFWSALLALQKFYFMRQQGFLSDYEVLQYNGKPAVELGFRVTFPDGFALRGYVDVVLRHRDTGAIVVIECKTTGLSTINPATYKNSSQAIGYSVVLDVIAPNESHYEVYYLVYKTKGQEYEVFPFAKSYLQRAQWIREVLFDIENIKAYAAENLFPMRGESCVRFFRDCKYLNTCTLSNSTITKPPTWGTLDSAVYDINLTLVDLIDSQLRKADHTPAHSSNVIDSTFVEESLNGS